MSGDRKGLCCDCESKEHYSTFTDILFSTHRDLNGDGHSFFIFVDAHCSSRSTFGLLDVVRPMGHGQALFPTGFFIQSCAKEKQKFWEAR